jgi:hypothetical protein
MSRRLEDPAPSSKRYGRGRTGVNGAHWTEPVSRPDGVLAIVMKLGGGGLLSGLLGLVSGLWGCSADGTTEVDVPTINVAIDDEIGSICATKADGRYQCWDPTGTPVAATGLPVADYVRVQLATRGAVGLTRDGHVHAVGTPVPDDLPPVVDFRATNMWGGQGLCFRSAAGAFIVGTYHPASEPESERWSTFDGTFTDVTCAYEGIMCGVRPDGTVSGSCQQSMPGSDWKQVALGIKVSCGLTTSGEVRCVPAQISTAVATPPAFAPGSYRQVAATYDVACALRVDGRIVCSRFDGVAIPAPPGSYVFIVAGRDLLCGIRPSGTTSCFRDDAFALSGQATAFAPLSPAIEAGW